MQVQLYGYLVSQNGYPVETVSLVAIARDGESEDVREHSEPYDSEMAEVGLQWIANLEQMVANGEVPEPEKDVYFCSRYCQFYDPTGVNGCPSKSR